MQLPSIATQELWMWPHVLCLLPVPQAGSYWSDVFFS